MHSVTMFNPKPTIQLIPIAGHTPIVIIDDFLLHPDALVAEVCQACDKFTNAPKNAFPGLELRMPESFSSRLNDFFIQHISKLLGARRSLSMFSRLSMITLAPDELARSQRICHQDQINESPQHCFAASVLYLFKNPELGGTSFYAPKIDQARIKQLYINPSAWDELPEQEATELFGTKPHYMTESNPYFELLGNVEAKWNRVIFYDGSIFHSGHITKPELLSRDPAQGRLTINGFFTCRKALG